MQQAALSYAATAQKTASPRELEAQLLLRAAAKLQTVAQGDTTDEAVREAVNFNRRLWTLLVSAVTDPASPLPKELRQNVANIGVFVLGRSVDLENAPQTHKLGALININRHLAAGLSGRA